MIRTLAAAAFALALVTPAAAGNPEPAPVDPVVAAPEPVKDDNWVLPLLIMAFFAVGLSN